MRRWLVPLWCALVFVSVAAPIADALTITATVPAGQTPRASALSIVVVPSVTVKTTSLPNGVIGTAYNQTLQAVGGTAPYTWSLATGIPPLGLSLSVAGAITGQPTTADTYNGTVMVTDANAVVVTSGLLSEFQFQWFSVNNYGGIHGQRIDHRGTGVTNKNVCFRQVNHRRQIA